MPGIGSQGVLSEDGGGGGGYYGGAGGGGGGGGGGGSGFGPPGTEFETGVREGHGLVVITYSKVQTALTTTAATSPLAEVPGGTTTDTAVLSGPGGAAAPRGTIVFRLFGPSDSTCTGTPVFSTSGNVTAFGSYSSGPSTALTEAGTYRWVATYSGDLIYAGATNACGDPSETVKFTVLPQARCAAGRQPGDVVGTAGHDVIAGTPGDDVIFGGAGNDRIDGLGGNDVICGEAGFDTLIGGDGSDALVGGPDHDWLQGGSGHDRLYGEAGADRLQGGTGNDVLYGGPGPDQLQGDEGDDSAYGEADHDMLDGGSGTNTLEGGTGINRCISPPAALVSC